MEIDDAIEVIVSWSQSEKLGCDVDTAEAFLFESGEHGASVEVALDLTYQEFGV